MISNAISQILLEKKYNRTCALIPFITAGCPDLYMTEKILYQLDREGADIIELGIPYSDSLADGPIIQQASKDAIAKGVYIDRVLDSINKVHKKIRAPIVVFTYYNPVLVRGVKKFIQDIASVGAKGLIIPDLPVEETDYIITICLEYNIELILFIAPTSSAYRMSAILSKAPGCIYLVSSTGVTGLRNYINHEIKDLSDGIKSNTDKLIMLGFGISNQDQVSDISKWNIDGIVIGSAFMKIVISSPPQKLLDDLGDFCRKMKLAILKK